MKRFIFQFLIHAFILFIVLGCDSEQKSQLANSPIERPKSSHSSFTKEKGKLTVLMDNSLTSYFIYQGQPMGFEYEMLDLFAKESKLKLEIKIINNVQGILDSLVAGAGDMVAANMTISKARLNYVSFTEPLFRTKQILVQRLPEDRQKMTKDQIEKSLIRDRLDLENKSISVRRNSSYELMLNNLILETGIDLDIDIAPGDYTTEQLIEMVAESEIDYTICDLNRAEMVDAYYDNVDINTPMSLSQPIAWAVKTESEELLSALNSWIDKRKGSLEFNVISNRYFKMTKRKARLIEKEYDFMKEGKISEYDDLIKKSAEDLNWDWRLLAALIYKESKFDPTTKSWRGAVGLMQLMPKTAKSYGIMPGDLTQPEKNLTAGIKHLQMLEKLWESSITDSLERIKFTLGSYNVGQGHVEDAMRLAEEYQLDSKKWDDNVAKMLLNKSIPKYYKDPVVKYGYCRGKEPFNYVRDIIQNYRLYSEFTN